MAAIAPRLAADVYRLNILAENIQDLSANVTRFLVLARSPSEGTTGHDKTAVVFSIRDRVGALRDLADAFRVERGQPVEHPVATVEAPRVGLRVLRRAGGPHLRGARPPRAAPGRGAHRVSQGPRLVAGAV